MEELIFGNYRRDADGRNYYILPKTEESFEARMLRETKPTGLLVLTEDEQEYAYEITGKKTLAVAFERVPMNADQIRKICGGILQIAAACGEYLLRTESLLLSPEQIYVDFPECQPLLCYYPEYRVPFFKQLGKLFEVFLNRVDYREEKAISLVYGLYMLLQEPDVTVEEVTRRLWSETEGREQRSTACPEKDWQRSEMGAVRRGAEPGDGQQRSEMGAVRRGAEPGDGWQRAEMRAAGRGAEPGDGRQRAEMGAVRRGAEPGDGRQRPEMGAVRRGAEPGDGRQRPEMRAGQERRRAGIDWSPEVETDCFLSGMKRNQWEKNGRNGKRTDRGKKKSIASTEKKRSWLESLFHKEGTGYYEELLPNPAYVEETPPEWGGQQTRVLSISGGMEEPALVSEQTGEPVYLTKFPFFIGSLEGYSDLTVKNDAVSRFHGKITRQDGEILLFDLNSTNGTRVNGTIIPVQQGVELRSGDRVCFAEEVYVFYDAGKITGRD